MFDCGEGTQHQFFRSNLSISQLRRIFVTHMHGDHTFGLMGLLSSAGLTGRMTKVDLYGPAELKDLIHACQQFTQTQFPYNLNIHPVKPGLVFEDHEYTVSCATLRHRIPAYGYRVQEKDRPGQFLVEKAKALGIPFGPLYGELKRGNSITLPDGRTINGTELCGPPKPGRSVVYCTDTIYSESSVRLAKDADVLIHESTYAHEDEPLAHRALHSTTRMAARVALEAGVKQLLLTHFSPRYTNESAITLDDLLKDARSIFPNTELAHDFLVWKVDNSRS